MLLEAPELRATLIRAGAIHGPRSPHPREWYFVKRALDGRRSVVLAQRGERIFHPVSSRNLAELIAAAARRPGTRVVNGGDPAPPKVVEIGRIISGHLDHQWTEVLLPGDAVNGVGDNPWNAPQDLELDMHTADVELGYRPAVDYAVGVAAELNWLIDSTRAADWHVVIRDHHYLEPLFDYSGEDELLRALGAPA